MQSFAKIKPLRNSEKSLSFTEVGKSYQSRKFLPWQTCLLTLLKIAIRGDGKSPDQKVIDMQLQAANLVYIFDVIILSVTANKSGRLTVETSFLPLNSSKGGTLKCKP